MCRHRHRHASRAFTTLDTGIHFTLHHVLKIIHSLSRHIHSLQRYSSFILLPRFYVKVVAVNAKGRSAAVTMKTSTVKETSRLPLLPPEQSEDRYNWQWTDYSPDTRGLPGYWVGPGGVGLGLLWWLMFVAAMSFFNTVRRVFIVPFWNSANCPSPRTARSKDLKIYFFNLPKIIFSAKPFYSNWTHNSKKVL